MTYLVVVVHIIREWACRYSYSNEKWISIIKKREMDSDSRCKCTFVCGWLFDTPPWILSMQTTNCRERREERLKFDAKAYPVFFFFRSPFIDILERENTRLHTQHIFIHEVLIEKKLKCKELQCWSHSHHISPSSFPHFGISASPYFFLSSIFYISTSVSSSW